MDSQFRCGKCARPVSSKFTKCLECGYLGPHTFNSSAEAPIEGGPPVTKGPKRRDTYPASQVDMPAPQPHPSHLPERYEAGPVEEEMPHHRAAPEVEEDDNKFPVGMRRRSPILDYVEDVDDSSQVEQRKRPEKDEDRDDAEEEDRFSSYDEEEGERREHPEPVKSNNTVTIIVTVILILLLAIAAIYVINNYDMLTKWLASPSGPAVLKPSE